MHPAESSFPALPAIRTHRTVHPHVLLRAGVLLLAAGMLLPSAFAADAEGEPPASREGSAGGKSAAPAAGPEGLDRALQAITRTFRQTKASELAPVLPENGKVFLSLVSLGGGAGYFGRGQVYFILERIFARQDTIRFTLSPRGNPGEHRDEGPAVVWCLGIWSFRRFDGLDDERQIHFILTCQKGLCSVMEIREAR